MVARSTKSASKEKPRPRSRAKAPAKNKGGRPFYQPTDEVRGSVKAMSGYGMPHEEIAKAIGICPQTLRKHFRSELDCGHAIASAKVLESLFKMATEGKQVAAAIWWTKARLGWKESQNIEITAEGMAKQIRQSLTEIDKTDGPDGEVGET
jgi:predicted transcriptional regulator